MLPLYLLYLLNVFRADDVDTWMLLQVWSKYGRKYEMTGTNPIATRVDDTTITIERSFV